LITIHTDGCCIGNHLHNKMERKSFAAFVVLNEKGKEMKMSVSNISEARSNQQAEWAALIEALKYCQSNIPGENITVYMDCETVVKMISGDYKARKGQMKIWKSRYDKYSSGLDIKIVWIPRAENLAGIHLENHLNTLRGLIDSKRAR